MEGAELDDSLLADLAKLPQGGVAGQETDCVNPSKVTFCDIGQLYRTNCSIRCNFEFTDSGPEESIPASPIRDGDFVGLYNVYKDLSEHVAAVYCKPEQLITEGKKFSLVFPAEVLPKKDNDFYHFIYVRKDVAYGSSTPFLLLNSCDDASLDVISEDDFLVVQSSLEKNVKQNSLIYEQKLQAVLKEKVDAQFLYDLQKKESEKLKTEKEEIQCRMEMQNHEMQKKNNALMQKHSELLEKHETLVMQIGILKNLLDEKEKNIKTNEARIEEQQIIKDTCKEQVCELVENNEKLDKTLKDKDEEIASYKSNLEAEKAARETLNTQLSECFSQINTLKKLLDEKDVDIASMKSDLDAERTSNQKLTTELSTFSTHIDALKKLAVAKEEEVASYKLQLEVDKSLNQKLTTQLYESTLQTEALEKLVDEKEGEIASQKSSLEAEKAECQSLSAKLSEIDTLRKLLEAKEECICTLEGQIIEDGSKREFSDLKVNNQNLMKTLKAKEEEIAAQKSALEVERTSSKQLATQVSECSSQLVALQKLVDEKQLSYKLLLEEIDVYEKKMCSLKYNVEELECKGTISDDEIKKCQAELFGVRKELDEANRNCLNLTREIGALKMRRDELLKLEIENKKLESKCKMLAEETHGRESKTLPLKEDFEKLETKCKVLVEEAQAYERKTLSLKVDLEKAKKSIQCLTEENEIAKIKKDELRKAEIENKKLQTINKSVSAGMKAMFTTMQNFKKDLEEANKTINNLKKENETLLLLAQENETETINNLKKENETLLMLAQENETKNMKKISLSLKQCTCQEGVGKDKVPYPEAAGSSCMEDENISLCSSSADEILAAQFNGGFESLSSLEFTDDHPKRNSDTNQWFEMFDTETSRLYYYNPMTETTTWKKPENSVIFSLEKLKQKKSFSEQE